MNIIITGTSSGIGFGLAKEFLNRNAKVWGISRRSPGELLKNENYRHLKLDLTSSKELKDKLPLFLFSQQQFDLVILNSGILGEIKLMSEVSVEEMKSVMEINVWANKLFLDILFGLNIGINQVVGMSSMAAIRSSPGWGSYSLSKAALDMLINIYSKEHTSTHFSAFAPGLVDSQITNYIYNLKDTEKYPSAKTLKEARYTDVMPDADTAAPKLIKGFTKALNYESGAHVDVREM